MRVATRCHSLPSAAIRCRRAEQAQCELPLAAIRYRPSEQAQSFGASNVGMRARKPPKWRGIGLGPALSGLGAFELFEPLPALSRFGGSTFFRRELPLRIGPPPALSRFGDPTFFRTDSPLPLVSPISDLTGAAEKLYSTYREQPNADLKPDPMRVATRSCHRSLG